VNGRACVSLFFFDICVGFEVELSKKRPEAIPALPDRLLTVLAPAVTAKSNWSAALPARADRVVSLVAGSDNVLDPLGAAVLRQTVLPLGELVSRFAAQKLAKPEHARYRVDSVHFVGDDAPIDVQTVRERFARAQFEELPDAKKLSLPAFEPMAAGVSLASDALRLGRSGEVDLDFITFVVGEEPEPTPYLPSVLVIDALAHQSPAALAGVRVSGARKYASGTTTVALGEERFTIVSSTDLRTSAPAHPIAQALAGASEQLGAVPRGRADAILAEHLRTHPADHGAWIVLSEDELPQAA
jgi:hypothetical protein